MEFVTSEAAEVKEELERRIAELAARSTVNTIRDPTLDEDLLAAKQRIQQLESDLKKQQAATRKEQAARKLIENVSEMSRETKAQVLMDFLHFCLSPNAKFPKDK